ncbi:MAG: response regulator transcription factor [Kofleriaceae bacterium]
MHVLVVEDHPRLAEAVATGLRDEAMTVTVAADGAAGLAGAAAADVVVLDLGLPDLDGVDVIHRLRARRVFVPILVLTARDAVAARVAALDAGADDYLVKPFVFAELVARLRALARRADGPRWSLRADEGLNLDDDLTLRVGDVRIVLSPREHALLGFLWRRRDAVVSKPEVLREVFGYAFDPGTNVIEVHLAHLRKKLDGTPVVIDTVRGAGLRLRVEGP